MNAPVRLVCGGCLRSVEVSPGHSGETSNTCPYCGGAIDSQEDDTRIQKETTRSVGDMLDADFSESDSNLGWTGTWSRGSLGSLGRFQLRERLGDGGFGQVFLAYDPRLDRDVALKVLKEPDPNERVMERFFREARAAARLDHPNIVAVHDAGFDRGRCWVAYHFVSGRPLNWYRDQHRLDPPTAARILRDLADAVDHAHHQGVLHRDIKPANVLIDDLGRPRLIDFGLSRRSDLDSSLTRDGAVVGTPAYMSPEQALGFSRQVDERSDVFSLGVIFFEVLSGQRPYPAGSESKSSKDAAARPPVPGKGMPAPSARAIAPSVPAALDRMCMRAIAQDPRDRYPSARALADDLDKWLLCHRGGKVRLSFSVSTIILGVAAAILLVIGVRTAIAPWHDPVRTTAGAGNTADLSPIKSLASEVNTSSPSFQPTGSTPVGGPARAQLIGNPSKGRYHLATCSDIQAMNPSNKIVLKDHEEARALGLQPCAHCRPLAGAAPAKEDEPR